MILFTRPQTADKHLVEAIHYKPELLPPERLSESYEVKAIPEAEVRKGFTPVMYFNPVSQEVFYEYKEAPEDEITALNKKVADLEALVANLMAKLES